jgi:hypothetical protein
MVLHCNNSKAFMSVFKGRRCQRLTGREIIDMNLKEPWVKTFGAIDGGLELMKVTWPTRHHQVFATQQDKMPALEQAVIEIWSSKVQTWEKGPTAGKACRVCWQE